MGLCATSAAVAAPAPASRRESQSAVRTTSWDVSACARTDTREGQVSLLVGHPETSRDCGLAPSRHYTSVYSSSYTADICGSLRTRRVVTGSETGVW